MTVKTGVESGECDVRPRWWARAYYSHNILTPHSIRGHAGYGPAQSPLTTSSAAQHSQPTQLSVWLLIILEVNQ